MALVALLRIPNKPNTFELFFQISVFLLLEAMPVSRTLHKTGGGGHRRSVRNSHYACQFRPRSPFVGAESDCLGQPARGHSHLPSFAKGRGCSAPGRSGCDDPRHHSRRQLYFF